MGGRDGGGGGRDGGWVVEVGGGWVVEMVEVVVEMVDGW